MAKPVVAIVGRPNVGKSTLVNRIAQNDEAIVHSMRGVTRDRSYHDADWNGISFSLIDTGGIEVGTEDAFQQSITGQALEATEEADAIVFVVDGKSGINTDDEAVARILQRSKAPVFVAVNKLDDPDHEEAMWEFLKLGLGNPYPISSLHGHGTGDLLDDVVGVFAPEEAGEVVASTEMINVAIIGRPNAGKSSLTNRLTQNERSIVSDVAGTTRDAIDSIVEHDGRLYRIVDTAGLRRISKMDENVEYYGYVRAMRAIDRADVVLLVIDSSLGLTNEDQRVASYAHERGCAMAILLNKWDLVKSPEDKAEIRESIEDRMMFVRYAPVIAICALTGKRLDRVWRAIDVCYANYTKKVPTSKLNAFLAKIRETGHSVTKGKTILRLKYVTQTSTKPPQFTFFCNRPDIVTDNFKRFLEGRIRASFDFEGTPVRLKFKKKD
ncbi:MAG: ribosome biogenesis GTPase Der [Eggerthellaceae bacterium]|nr:ribosome biogenesis GTPase Der [Eggerthellaceae bacterium]